MSVAYLSQAWLDLLVAEGGRLPERPGATARLQHVVTGAPDGEVRYHQQVMDGRVTSATLGDDPDAAVTFTQTYADARQITEGEVDVHVAFMRGRVKVVGDMGTVMALMPLTDSDEYRTALAKISAQTSY